MQMFLSCDFVFNQCRSQYCSESEKQAATHQNKDHHGHNKRVEMPGAPSHPAPQQANKEVTLIQSIQ
jgi:hypothetical protein